VAQPRREAFRDQRRFGTVTRHGREQRQRDGNKHQRRYSRIEQGEIDEAVHRDENAADDVHVLAADDVGQMPGHDDEKEPEDRLNKHGHQHEIAAGAEHGRGIGEDEGADDITRRLLRHTQQGGQQHLLGLALQHLQHRYAFDALLSEYPPKYWGFEDTEPNPQPDTDHDDAEKERNSPAPNEKLVARQPAKEQHRQIREEQPRRTAELRPGRDKTTVFGGARPLHCQQYRAAPFAADPDPLDQAYDRQQDGAPDAHGLIGGDETHG